ncbi:hypothetical protein [Calothrix sp. NIES-2098]|uniref:hypothetical protein n=1 Tax=Calothrix sp. NIES-2098 TaxID=1954171 RepID=UPI0030DD2375
MLWQLHFGTGRQRQKAGVSGITQMGRKKSCMGMNAKASELCDRSIAHQNFQLLVELPSTLLNKPVVLVLCPAVPNNWRN